MTANRLFTGLFWPLVLGTGLSARAQSQPASLPPAASSQLGRYTAAHDSLMRLVANIHTQAESRMNVFVALYGSFGGLHRRNRIYSSASSSIFNTRSPVRSQSIKHRFGVEFEKIKYYDYYGHKVLMERYEDHQLTRLELKEYSTHPGDHHSLTTHWLFIRGDYLKHTSLPSLSTTGPAKTSYFFNSRPKVE